MIHQKQSYFSKVAHSHMSQLKTFSPFSHYAILVNCNHLELEAF